jgi:integrase/recombinase XerC
MHEQAVAQVDDFLRHLQAERRLSEHTVAAYRHDVGRLRSFCDRRSLEDWRQLDVHAARAFAGSLRQAGLAPRSIQRALSAARALYRYLRREGVVGGDPFAGLAAPRAQRRLPKTLNTEQATLLVSVAAADPLAVRDRAMLELFYSCGLRLSELVQLDLPRIDLRQGLVRVVGKGGKTREVPVGRHAVKAVQQWLPQRAAWVRGEEPALFVSRGGRRLGARNVQQRVRLWARRQGLNGEVHPHMLRHSFATHVLESSGELRAVQELLGHADISTTQIYTHLDFQHLAKVYDAAHPRARRGRRGR